VLYYNYHASNENDDDLLGVSYGPSPTAPTITG
jgi:hypothetical protein